MDLPKTREGYTTVLTVVCRFSKMCHFVPLVDTDVVSVARAYIRDIARLHGFPSSIVADRDPRWTSRFW